MIDEREIEFDFEIDIDEQDIRDALKMAVWDEVGRDDEIESIIDEADAEELLEDLCKSDEERFEEVRDRTIERLKEGLTTRRVGPRYYESYYEKGGEGSRSPYRMAWEDDDGPYLRPASIDTEQVDIEEALEEADIDADEIAAELEEEDQEDEDGSPSQSVNTANVTVEDDGSSGHDISAPTGGADITTTEFGTCEGPTSGAFYEVDEDGTVEANYPSSDSNTADDGSDDEDDETPSFVYECPRSVPTDDGDTEPCSGTHESTKDYGEHVFRRCPDCEKEVAMIRGK